jgi:murein DD-endopeptidase MepM/ murein hydrolase activator NlpD
MKFDLTNFLELDTKALMAINGGGTCGGGSCSSGGSSYRGGGSCSSSSSYGGSCGGVTKGGGNCSSVNLSNGNGGGGKSDSIYGAPTDSRRVTGVVGEETSLQSVHTGIDIGALEPGKKGDPIYAIADSVILRVGTTSNSGSSILELDLPNTDDTAVYQHAEFIVAEGATVRKGDIIGYMSDIGTPGQVHLHFEIRQDGLYAGTGGTGELVNPLDYLPTSYTIVN